MIHLDRFYFDWLLDQINPDGVTEGVAYLCGLLHSVEFKRRVGNDVNRALDGINLRREFLDNELIPSTTASADELLSLECSWLEMMIALASQLDFLYEGGVDGRFLEMVNNMGLGPVAAYGPIKSEATLEYEKHLVRRVTNDIDTNNITSDGHGGLFPLKGSKHPDQRRVEIWLQHAAYFNEKLEGVLWTSTE